MALVTASSPQFSGIPDRLEQLKDRLRNRRLVNSRRTENGMGQAYTHPRHPVVERAVELAKETGAETMLEIGAGQGAVSLQVAKKADPKNIVATDINAIGLSRLQKTAHKKNLPVTTQLFNATQTLPDILKERFDLVVAKDVMPFLDPQGANRLLENIAAALKPGGWFLLSTASMRSWMAKKNPPVNTGNPYYRKLSDGDQQFIQTTRPAFSFESPRHLAQKLERLGLDLTELKHFGRAKGWFWAVGQKSES